MVGEPLHRLHNLAKRKKYQIARNGKFYIKIPPSFTTGIVSILSLLALTFCTGRKSYLNFFFQRGVLLLVDVGSYFNLLLRARVHFHFMAFFTQNF